MQPLTRVTKQTLAVLQAFLDSGDRPVWGLALSKQLGIPTGSIYPMLDRLVENGWLQFSWEDDAARLGPRKKLYTLSKGGVLETKRLLAEKDSFEVAPKKVRVV